jgi:uncharacterized protein (DUF427 family)
MRCEPNNWSSDHDDFTAVQKNKRYEHTFGERDSDHLHLPTRRRVMTDKPVKIPGPDHPISIEANPSRIVVKVGGKIIADTRAALTLREASYPPVQYIPRRDVDMAALMRSEHTSYCPYKGDASYYSIPAGGDRSRNAVWTYEAPFEVMAQIKDYVAFYPDRVDEIS